MRYSGKYLNEISFTVGGIGTGSIGVAGNGNLIDWEIFGNPNKASTNGFTHIMVRAKTKGKSTYRVLQGDHTTDLSGKTGSGFGQGVLNKTMAGFRHFKNCEFIGEYPIATLNFSDDNFPGEISLTAFNPLIPLDSKNSSIPAAFFEITYHNTTDSEVEFEPLFSLRNPFPCTANEKVSSGEFSGVRLFHHGKVESDLDYGELCLMCENPNEIQKYWFRGRANDAVIMFLNELDSGKALINREYEGGARNDVCTLTQKANVAAGDYKKFRFVLSWNVPNDSNAWIKRGDEDEPEDESLLGAVWKKFYATVFPSALSSAEYSLKNWDYLYEKTLEYKNELFSSTVDSAVIDAAASTVSVIKSAATYRLEGGEYYGFEGTDEKKGSCPGTCQHVYNYAYALCFLFPDLERSVRELEFNYAVDENGGTTFRLPLPPSAPKKLRACLDGQMGCVIKAYREWKISGDTEWLRRYWPTVKKILEYAWSEKNPWAWDRNCDGVLEGKQHNTLDLDMFGPSAWLEGIYLAALKAAAEMAEFLGEADKQKEYTALFEKGYAYTKENLWGGEYFIQKIDLNDKSIVDRFDYMSEDYFNGYWSEELGEIRYQTGEGSSIDQLCGQWHANILGLGRIFDKDQTDAALKSMYRYNFKKSFREYDNTWRVYGLNDEGGAVICAYPETARKPLIPIMYCEECMNGFEYELAGLFLSEGKIDEGTLLVRAVRERYNGYNRNPYNEIECGSNYARSMASFALLPLLSGFKFDLPRGIIGFDPKVNKDNFRSIWCLGTGWGRVEVSKKETAVTLLSGSLKIKELHLPYLKTAQKLVIDGKEVDFHLNNGVLSFESITANKEIKVFN